MIRRCTSGLSRRPAAPGRAAFAIAVGMTLVMAALACPPARAQAWRGPSRPPNFRLSAAADWELWNSDSEVAGYKSTSSTFRQLYTTGLDGVVWDPRFARFSLGLELLMSDHRTSGQRLDVNDHGYWAQLFLFPNRPFPLRIYGRQRASDSSGGPAVNDRRELSNYGVEWKLLDHGARQLRVLWDANETDIFAPPRRQESERTTLGDFRQAYRRGELFVQANRQTVEETVIGLERTRQNYLLTNHTGFGRSGAFVATLERTDADAVYSSGEQDDLTTGRASVQVELPSAGRAHWSLAYDYNSNDGKYVDSTTQEGRAFGRFPLSAHWEGNVSGVAGRLRSGSADSAVDQDRVGARAGANYSRGWNRFRLTAVYTLGFDDLTLADGVSSREIGYRTEISGAVGVGQGGDVHATVSRARNQNDATGVGYTYDETRAALGASGGLGADWKFDGSVSWRDSTYDTIQFGVQDARELGLRGTLTHWRGSLSFSLGSQRGVSDYTPLPGNAAPIAPGTYLVNEADTASAGGMWRITPRLRLQFQAALERRSITVVGDENVVTYHPELVCEWRAWRVAAGYAHWQRTNSATYRDDTLLIKVTRLFL